MSKKINLGTINSATLTSLSQFNVAIEAIKVLSDGKRAEIKKLEDEKAIILKNRQQAIDQGKTEQEAISLFSIEEVVKKIRKVEEDYKKAVDPHLKNKKQAQEKLVPVSLYHSYQLAMIKGDLAAKGELTIEKKSGNEEYTINKSFKEQIKEFLVNIGCDASNDTALTKFVQVMAVRNAGVVQCNKGTDYVKVKSASQFNNIFIRNFLQYCIKEKGVITVNKDNTLSMTVYEDEQAKDQNKNK